jgi:hypothetical protein
MRCRSIENTSVQIRTSYIAGNGYYRKFGTHHRRKVGDQSRYLAEERICIIIEGLRDDPEKRHNLREQAKLEK